MASALIVGDIHLSERPPSSRQPTYLDDILVKLEFCVRTANELDVPIAQAGDVFNLKAPSKNSHRLVQATHEVLSEAKHGCFMVPGNHDLSQDRLDSLPAQPLGALGRMKNMTLLMGTSPDLPGIGGIPYLTEFDGGNWQDAVKPWFEKVAGCELLITHAPIFPYGQEPGVYFSIDLDEWVELASWFGIYRTYFGHIHDAAGTFTHRDHTFCNQGALSRGSLHESSVSRKPAVTLYSGGEFTRIEVPHKPAEDVFLLAQAEQAAENKASALEFAAQLGSTKIAAVTIESVAATLREQVQDKTVLSVIEKCLEEVQ